MTLLTNVALTQKNSLARSLKTTQQILNGEATLKDVRDKNVKKMKNNVKTAGKYALATTALSTTAMPFVATALDVDITKKLPKFIQSGLKKFQELPAVKNFAQGASEGFEFAFNTLAKTAKAHPLATLGCIAISTASSLIGYKLIANHSKEEGRIEQRYDDIVEIRTKQNKENPLTE